MVWCGGGGVCASVRACVCVCLCECVCCVCARARACVCSNGRIVQLGSSPSGDLTLNNITVAERWIT